MMAIQFIIGQLNSPIEQMLSFVQQLQDAKISLERLNEIKQMDDEESSPESYVSNLCNDKGIMISNLFFNYPGDYDSAALSNITMKIEEGKTTAIVGMSGSGKTTLLKLLLRFYEPTNGDIKVGRTFINQISFRQWRELCGVVLQDGFIFSDTIARNICVTDEYPDVSKLNKAIEIANIDDFIKSQPKGLDTKIGAEGKGISQGQRQRILIARAIYKDPKYILFDEATNALDAHNEKVIMGNLEQFFRGRTVVVVAHRLSTVMHADNIVVLDKGQVAEQGTHTQLIKNNGIYYNLVKNQLALQT
jgi:ATP-binding cassette subfamily B protein